MSNPWLHLQLADSGFPAGGFAHSGGLESAIQMGLVKGSAAVGEFVVEALWQLGQAQLPLLSHVHALPSSFSECDERAHVFIANQVVRRASQQQGRAFFETCARIFPPVEALRANKVHWHHAPAFGACLERMRIPLRDAQVVYLSMSLRGLLSAAVRLNALGTHEAQRLQLELHGTLDDVLRICGPLRLDDLQQTSPILDLIAASHDRLYSRLFLS